MNSLVLGYCFAFVHITGTWSFWALWTWTGAALGTKHFHLLCGPQGTTPMRAASHLLRAAWSLLESSSTSRLYYLDFRAWSKILLLDFSAPYSTWETWEGPGVLFGHCSSRISRDNRVRRPPAQQIPELRIFLGFITMNSLFLGFSCCCTCMTE